MARSNLYFLLIFICFVLPLEGQEIIEIWPNNVPGETAEKHLPVSKKNGGVTRLSDVNNPRLKVYKPMKSNDNGHSILVCPGGGYQILAIDLEGSEIAFWLSDIGFTVYVLEYRVPSKYGLAMLDAQRAMQILRSRSPQGKKIGILGFSAGGHLSARVSTNLGGRNSEHDYLLSKDSWIPDFTVLIYPAYLDRGVFNNLSPEIQLSETTPPMFIFMTADDPYVNGSYMLAHALMKNKTSVEFHIYPEGGHGYGLRKEREVGKVWTELCESWLMKQIEE